MSRLLFGFLILSGLLCSRPGSTAEFDYLPDHPGTASAVLEASNCVVHGLGPAESKAYLGNLARLRDLLLQQPTFQPPRGVRVRGTFRADDEPAASRAAPVPGYGTLRFFPCFADSKTKEPVFFNETTDEVVAYVNQSTGGLEPFNCPECDAHWYYEPRRTGEIDGDPVYRGPLGCEHIVLGRDRSAPWVPVTREEYVRVWIRVWEKQNARNPQDMFKQMIARHQEALAAMSPEERREQARYGGTEDPFAPALAPAGSTEGLPLVKAGSDWYDPALPRTAIQLVLVKFWYSGEIDADHPAPTEYGQVSPLRVWEALHHSKWTEVAAVLASRPSPAAGR